MAVGENKDRILFLEDEETNTSSAGFSLTTPGEKYLIVSGTTGGATVDLEILASDGTWVVISGSSFVDETGAKLLRGLKVIPKVYKVRATISGGTSASITVELTK